MSSMNPTVKRILPWAPLIVALILGLILGLLIGWVWWPVSWTNASIADLSTTQRAEYVGAVAEAYHFDGTTAARQRMEARLAPFGANTDEALTGAIEYYRSLPVPDEVMVANLALLATDLGIPVDAAMMASDPGAAPADAAEAAPAEAAVADAAASDTGGGSGIFTWLLAVILSVALIGAGFYLLMRLRAPRDLTDAMKEPSAPVAPGAMQPVAGGTAPPARTTAWGRNAGASSAAVTATAVAEDDDLSFDDDDAEEPAVRFSDASGDTGAPDADDDFNVATPRYASARADAESYAAYSGSSLDDADDANEADAEDTDAEDTDDDPFADAEGGDALGDSGAPVAIDAPIAPQPATSRGPNGGPVPADAPPVDINALTPPSWAAVNTKGAGSKGSAGVANTVMPTGVAVAAPVKLPATKPIASFTLQYFAGVADYIEAHNITDPTSGKYIGECGMGVSGKNPVLHNEPNQVIALDVWMYDKLDARENANSTRVLLSPYAVAHNLAQAFGEGAGAATIEARKGAHFGVDGRNLYLEGELQDVDYDANGVFRTAKVHLNVLPKA